MEKNAIITFITNGVVITAIVGGVIIVNDIFTEISGFAIAIMKANVMLIMMYDETFYCDSLGKKILTMFAFLLVTTLTSESFYAVQKMH